MEGSDSRLAGLALSWLLTRPRGKRGARGDLERALRPFIEHRWSRSEWASHLDALVEALARSGDLQVHARGGLELTAAGRERARRFLGEESLPRGLTWARLKQTWLLARGLGMTPSKPVLTRLANADGLRAALLHREHGLPGTDTSTLAQVRDRLLWRQLGVESDAPFSLRAVQAHLLGRMLESKASDPELALKQLVARTVKAPRSDAEALRLAAIRGWLLPEEARAELSSGEGITTFAERVLAVARASKTGRFGQDKVFISHVWKALQPEWSNREAFEQRLLEANRARRLSLRRADLVEAMDPADVTESEVRSFGASFHFVVI